MPSAASWRPRRRGPGGGAQSMSVCPRGTRLDPSTDFAANTGLRSALRVRRMVGGHMTTRRRALALATTGLFTLLFPGKAFAQNVSCPICGNSAYFTGEVRTDVTGKLLSKYQCMMFVQHVFWVPS